MNLGTIYYRLRQILGGREILPGGRSRRIRAIRWREFNLGNLYDEQGRTREATRPLPPGAGTEPGVRRRAFQPGAAVERAGDALKAVHHWKTYLKLDNSGQWADIARKQLDRLRQAVIR